MIITKKRRAGGYLFATRKSQIGAAFLLCVTFYVLLTTVVFPREEILLSSLPSGVHTVSGGQEILNDLFPAAAEGGASANAAATRTKHGDDDDVCFHYDGILLISYADRDGFATVFFLYIMNQLLYAETHNLLPWIHLDSETSTHVYDETEHGYEDDSQISLGLHVLNGLHWDKFYDQQSSQNYSYPGKPVLDYQDPKSVSTSITLNGTGIWSSYFDPPSRLDPLRHLADPSKSSGSSCHTKPIFQLTLPQIEPSLMVYCPYSVRAWRRRSTPPSLAQWNIPYQEWFDPMRQSAHEVVQRHYHPTEEMVNLAHRANPVVEGEEACLAIHIRHSDKADRRKPIPIDDFLPYIDAYFKAAVWVGTRIVIYVATDSNQVIEDIQNKWPKKLTSYFKFQKGSMGQPVTRSDNETAVFKLSQDHHRTNTEVFVDILAMAKCEFMIHGMSAVSEAVHYLNPRLHSQSVNLEEELPSNATDYLRTIKPTMTDKEFGKLVMNRLDKKRRGADAEKAKLDHSV